MKSGLLLKEPTTKGQKIIAFIESLSPTTRQAFLNVVKEIKQESKQLSKYGKGAGYVLLAVDTKSLTTFSQVWNGEYLEGFLLIHRTTDGPAGYPTFGKSPYHLIKANN